MANVVPAAPGTPSLRLADDRPLPVRRQAGAAHAGADHEADLLLPASSRRRRPAWGSCRAAAGPGRAPVRHSASRDQGLNHGARKPSGTSAPSLRLRCLAVRRGGGKPRPKAITSCCYDPGQPAVKRTPGGTHERRFTTPWRACSSIAGLAWPARAPAAAPPASLTLSRLETNAAAEPLGHRRSCATAHVGPASATERGVMQAAYRVLVASTPELARESRADVWDSGRIAVVRPVGRLRRRRRSGRARATTGRVRVWPSIRTGERVGAADVVRDGAHERQRVEGPVDRRAGARRDPCPRRRGRPTTT